MLDTYCHIEFVHDCYSCRTHLPVSRYTERRWRRGRRKAWAQDAKSSAQIHMRLADWMKHFLRTALGQPTKPVSWLWCALNSRLIRMCCWEFVCVTAKHKGRLWLAQGPRKGNHSADTGANLTWKEKRSKRSKVLWIKWAIHTLSLALCVFEWECHLEVK